MSGTYGRISDTRNDFSGEHEKPYTELADIYDRVMNHVDYTVWAEYVSIILERYGILRGHILEIACGTGSLALELHKLGLSITGTDLSHSMLRKAREKYQKAGIPSRLCVSSMNTLPFDFRFDAVLCIYDSINYMTTPGDFIATINGVSDVLRDGGIFVFDVCTIKNSELFFTDHSMVENFGDVRYERLCRFNRRGNIQENHFVIQKNGRRYVENHYQKIYRLVEISDMIAMTPLVECGRFDDMSLLPGNEDSERVHFVLQKPVTG